MPGRDEHASGHWLDGPQRRLGGAALALAAIARALEAESDRLSLWIPVLFGGGILVYFALPGASPAHRRRAHHAAAGLILAEVARTRAHHRRSARRSACDLRRAAIGVRRKAEPWRCRRPCRVGGHAPAYQASMAPSTRTRLGARRASCPALCPGSTLPSTRSLSRACRAATDQRRHEARAEALGAGCRPRRGRRAQRAWRSAPR